MTIIATMTQHYSNVVKREFSPEWGYCKKVVTINTPTAASLGIGSVLGAYVASPVGTAGAVVGTGNGTVGAITVVSTAVLEIATYTVKATSASAFVLLSPVTGRVLGIGAFGVLFSQAGFSFTVTAGATAFVAGDSFPIVVTGTLKYKLNDISSTDGSEQPRVVIVGDATGRPMVSTVLANTDINVLIMYRGPAAVADASLVFAASVTSGTVRTASLAQFTANSGIDVLTQL